MTSVDFAQGELGNGGTDKQGRHSRTGDGRPMPRKEVAQEGGCQRCKQTEKCVASEGYGIVRLANGRTAASVEAAWNRSAGRKCRIG